MTARTTPLIVMLVLGLAAPGCDRRIDVDLNYAIEREDFKKAETLLEQGADINARFLRSDGETPLMMAVETESNPERVEWLLDHGAELDLTSFSGYTALHVAASHGRSRQVQILLAAGAEVNRRNDRGQTPLELAHKKGHKIVERLIREAGGEY